MEDRNIFTQDFQYANEGKNKFFMMATLVLSTVLVVGIGVVYKYAKFDGVDTKTLTEKYVDKTKVNFEDLPFDIKDQYILKSKVEYLQQEKTKSLETKNAELTKKVDELNQQITTLTQIQDNNHSFVTNQDQALSQVQNNHEFVKIPQEPLQEDGKSGEKFVKTFAEVTKMQHQGLTFVKYVSCDDMAGGRYKLTEPCKAKLKKFLSNYNSKYVFEIIPTVDDDDFALINKFKAVNETLPANEKFSKDRIELLNKYANTGLGKYRSNEVGWLIRAQVGKNANIKYVPYHVYSKSSKGVIVKVYK